MSAQEFLQYKHPLEDDATIALRQKLLGDEYIKQVCEIYKTFDEEKLMPDLIGKAAVINECQMPEIYSIFKRYAELLEMDVPDIYVFEGMFVSINAEGLDHPWIQITARTFDVCDQKELEYLIARQMVHIKLGHMKYEVLNEQFIKTIKMTSQYGVGMTGFVPGLSTISQKSFDVYCESFKLVGARWSRISEYTADRCALALLNWDIKTAIRAIKKEVFNSKTLGDEVKLSAYLMQTNNILALESPMAKFSIMDELCPYGPFRLKDLISFASTKGNNNNLSSEMLKTVHSSRSRELSVGGLSENDGENLTISFENKIENLATRYFGDEMKKDTVRFYPMPSMYAECVTNSISAYGREVGMSNEDVILILDDTIFSNAKKGFIISSTGIATSRKEFWAFGNMDNLFYSSQKNELRISKNGEWKVIYSTDYLDDECKVKLASFINELSEILC